MTSIEGFFRGVARVLHRIADGFANIGADGTQRCEVCGARTRGGERFCSEHRDERTFPR
jgi:hypothetical protein